MKSALRLPRKIKMGFFYVSVNVELDPPQAAGYNFYELASSRRESIRTENSDRDDLNPANRG